MTTTNTLTPRRIRRERTPGWRASDVSTSPYGYRHVGRGTPWGNPFRIVWEKRCWRVIDSGGKSRSLREEPQTFARQDKFYAAVVATRLYELHTGPMGLYEFSPDDLALIREELGRKDLLCWCPLPKPGEKDYCHAAHLLRLANPTVAFPDPH